MPLTTATTRVLPRTRNTRLRYGVSAITITLLALSACAPNTADSHSHQSPTAADTSHGAQWQQKNFSNVYDQTIDWHTCGEDDGLDSELAELLDFVEVDRSTFQCATVTTPLNWADPSDTRTVSLAVMRIPSTGQDAPPLFNNPGGPGASGIEHTMTLPISPGFDDVMGAYELWGFDPRGVGKSTPVDCDSADEASTVALSNCVANNPIAVYMGTSQVARDMELLRHLSGAEQLNYHGYSYGTMLGATYATLFPDKTGRMVLDSADDAQWASLMSDFDQQVAISKAVGELADSCSTMTTSEGEPITCPFTSEREMLDDLNRLNETPLTSSDGEEFTGESLKDYLTNSLYSDTESLLDMLGRAQGGDHASIDAVVAVLKEDGAEVGSAGMLALCPSSPKDPDIAGLIDHMKTVGVPEFMGGPDISDDVIARFARFYLDCAAVPSTGTDLTSFSASAVDTPILVVGVTGDHATPYEHSATLAEQLGKAILLTLDSNGHGASYSGRSMCVDDQVTQYLLNGSVPEAGMTCPVDPTE